MKTIRMMFRDSLALSCLIGYAAVISSLFIVGCKVREPEQVESGVVLSARGNGGVVQLATLEDGTRCAVLIGSNKGGIDCDWKPNINLHGF